MPLTLEVCGTADRHLQSALDRATHVFSMVDLPVGVQPHTNLTQVGMEMPDPTAKTPWNSAQLRAFKLLAATALAAASPSSDRTLLFVCRKAKNRSRALLLAVATALNLDVDCPPPVDPDLAELARLVFTHDYEKLTRWPPEGRPRAKRARA